MVRFFCFLFVLFLPGLHLRAEVVTKYVIVSDIDDTIQKTQVHWQLDPKGFLKNLFAFHDAYIGMPALYNALAFSGHKIYYLTGTPSFLAKYQEKFLETSGFPVGTLITRDSVGTSTYDFKVKALENLMRIHSQSQFVFIGDNGQQDILAYQTLRTHPELGRRVNLTMIHQVYGSPEGKPLQPEQKSYVSSAEISLTLRQHGLIDKEITREVLRQVERGLQSQSPRIKDLTIPKATPITETHLRNLEVWAQTDSDPIIAKIIRSIVSLMDGRMRSEAMIEHDEGSL